MNDSPSAGNRVLKCPHPDAWLPWTEYVYLWVCGLPGGMHVKVGVTNNPDRRAAEFRTNSPARATNHLICQCPDRAAAFALERAILSANSGARVRGEWLRVEAPKLHKFVAACTAIAKEQIGEMVRFREHRPRQPNGERFRKGRRR